MTSIETLARRVQGRRHMPELQALRGLAALVVVLHHCTFYYANAPGLRLAAERAFNGHGAVVLFFVLSGFVLALSLQPAGTGRATPAGYLLRRGFRIYPMLWCAVGLALGYAALFHDVPLAPSVAAQWWQPGFRELPDLPGLVKSLLGVGTRLPLPIWTLRIELVGSCLLPPLVWLSLRRPRWFVGVLALSLVAPLVAGDRLYLVPLYLCGFAVGAALVPLSGRLATWRRGGIGLIAGGALVLWFGRLAVAGHYEVDYHNAAAVLLETFAAAALILGIHLRPEAVAILKWPALVWLGDISYSLYLVHMPVLGLVAGVGTDLLRLPVMTGDPRLATLVVTLAVLAVSLPLSALAYRTVEVPMMALGKRLAARWQPRRAEAGRAAGEVAATTAEPL